MPNGNRFSPKHGMHKCGVDGCNKLTATARDACDSCQHMAKMARMRAAAKRQYECKRVGGATCQTR